MAGNSSRRGAVRRGGKGATTGSGGQRRRALKGKGPTPKAEDRTGHPAARRSAAAARRAGNDAGGRGGQGGNQGRGGRGGRDRGVAPELLVGRNPVAEALRLDVPAMALYVALGVEADERVTEAVRLAGDRGLPLMEVSRNELDRITGGLLHQGLALQVPPYQYTDFGDLVDEARATISDGGAPLLVALDGVTDPRNLGAVLRSAAAFGAQGVVIPQRRAAAVTAAAWRTSAGAAARVPVAQVTNLVRALREAKQEGMLVVGLDADGDASLDDFELATEPLVVVVGSEGRGLSRLVGDTCDLRVSIPMTSDTESLNASVAAAITLAEIARRRRLDRV